MAVLPLSPHRNLKNSYQISNKSRRFNNKIKAKIVRTFNALEQGFIGLAQEILKPIEDNFLQQAKRIIENHTTSVINDLKLDFSKFNELLFQFFIESRKIGRLHGISEALELKQYYERRRKKLERNSFEDITTELISNITSALSPENKYIATNFSVVPYEALNYYRDYSLSLKGDIEQDLLKKAKNIIYSGIENGKSIQEMMFGLESIFPEFKSNRLQNIARTETSKAYNKGRLDGFKAKELNGFILAVQFSSILDSRTTDICEERHGLILALDDPRLEANTPPLHFMCRSVLIPVDKYSLIDEGLEGKIGQGWDNIQNPMKGFGG